MYVAIDEQGYFFDPETDQDLEVTWDDYGRPIDANSGAVLQFWGESGFDGGQITQAVRDIVIGIWGNPESVRANAPRDRLPAQSIPQVATNPVLTPTPRQRQDGAGINISTNMLMLIVGGFLLFYAGMNKGGRR